MRRARLGRSFLWSCRRSGEVGAEAEAEAEAGGAPAASEQRDERDGVGDGGRRRVPGLQRRRKRYSMKSYIVTEGKTDEVLLSAVLKQLLPDMDVYVKA